jgi:hypothetical protein
MSASFEDELCAMYRDSGAGKEPLPPAMLAMVLVMQAYTGVSDAEAVERARFDARWQLVLGVLGAQTRPFSQGALCAFRDRLIAHDMDRRLLERTAEFARSSRGFDSKKLPKVLRLAVDSRPLAGAGRVEDSVNLLARAGRQLLVCGAMLARIDLDELAKRLKVELFLASSIKAALDVDWTDDEQRSEALRALLAALDTVERWVRKRFGAEAEKSPLVEHLEMVARLRAQDIDPEPPDGGGPGIRDGVAAERVISLGDVEMRHGRKSKSRTVNGYKAHVATAMDDNLVLAASVLPANRPESEGLDAMRGDLGRVLEFKAIKELHVDRAYVRAALAVELAAAGVEVVSKPRPSAGKPGLFHKKDFKIDLRAKTATCPGDQTVRFVLGQAMKFDGATCGQCRLRPRCTEAAEGRGRTLTVPVDEAQQRRLRKLVSTANGRQRLRQRVAIEHTLSHHARAQGTRARYLGQRRNTFDSRRAGALLNLEEAQRALAA